MKAEVEVRIDAPPDVVFDTALDIPRWPAIISAITSTEMLSEGPLQVGSRFRETRIMFGREASEDMTIAELDRPRRYVFTAENHGARYLSEHDLIPDGEATRFIMRFSGTPASLTARLMAPLGWFLAGTMRKMIAGDLEDLKKAVEGQIRSAE